MSLCTENRSTEQLLAHYASSRCPNTRALIIEQYSSLVRSVAMRYARPGVPVEDLIQQAFVALIGALDRFDPNYETRFSTFAVHNMVGEIKRYFRDKTWHFKIPRRLQEIATNLHLREEELGRILGRTPTVPELAAHVGVSEEIIAEAMAAISANFGIASIDHRREDKEGDTFSIAERLGEADTDIEEAPDRIVLSDAIELLDERLQYVIRQRFFEGRSQQEIAGALGLSQMHVSRLERSALARLKMELLGEKPPEKARRGRKASNQSLDPTSHLENLHALLAKLELTSIEAKLARANVGFTRCQRDKAILQRCRSFAEKALAETNQAEFVSEVTAYLIRVTEQEDALKVRLDTFTCRRNNLRALHRAAPRLRRKVEKLIAEAETWV